MSTYNGEKYLNEQIDSILSQKDVHVELFIRDDGSTDGTHEIISDYVSRYDNIHAEFGENLGYSRSFIHELGAVEGFDYYAFSDQDDVWLEGKLASAVKAISQQEASAGRSTPVMWQSNLYITDDKLNIVYKTALDKRIHTLEAIIMRDHAVGNAMVMNKKARDLIKRSDILELFKNKGHDMYILFMTNVMNGIVITDSEAYVYYRQHSHNTAGTPTSLINRIKIEYRRFNNVRGVNARLASMLLQVLGDEITPEIKKTLTLIAGHKDK